MNRTRCVARVATCLFSVLALGCSCGTEQVVIDAGNPIVPDAAIDAGNDAGQDTSTVAPGCAQSGSAGAHCRAGLCLGGITCAGASGAVMDVQTTFDLRQAGADDPAHPGYPVARTVLDPAELAPLNAAEASLCAQQCDTSGALDTCGACASCSTALTQMPLVAAFGGARILFGAGADFGSNTGVCRLDCTWHADARSDECPDDAMACDSFGSVCVEACTSDVECNTTYGITYAGEIVTTIDTAGARTCSPSTGRCEVAGRAGAAVGDACASDADCAPGTGVCLAGGRCGELACPGPGTPTSTCAAGRGVCLVSGAGAHPQSICILGCHTSADCGAGSACSLFGGGATIGGLEGFCVGRCSADDACIAGETCTDGMRVDASGATVATPGQCVPRCSGVGAVGPASGGCARDEVCLADHPGASYGFCEPADRFCGATDARSLPAASTECATGWVCDETLAGRAGRHDDVADGHCTPACASDADCAGRGACVTTGSLAGLCRTACASDGDCAAPSVCDGTIGWCVEVAPPA